MGLKDHVIVCGWNQNGERLVKDLQATRPDTEIVILVDREDVRRVMAPNIHYVIADPTTEEGLNKARLKQADVVAVLSDDADGRSKQDADARAILTVLAVEKLNPRVHSIVELVNPDNDFHVKNAGVDEILISESYTGTMLSQAVQYPGLSEVFTDLFDTGKGSQLRQIDVPEEIIGKKFSEASGDFFRGQQGILVGYRRRNNLVMSPEDDIEFQPGDKAVLVRRI